MVYCQELWGTGLATRDFLYVDDCVRAILLALEHDNRPDPINLGTGVETRIKDIPEMIKLKLDWEGDLQWDSSKPDGQPRRYLDTSKAEELFGFKATTTL